MFRDGWDSYILRAYQLATEETQNYKTILTGYLGKHHRVNGVLKEIDRWTGYPLYSIGNAAPNINLRGTAVIKISDFPHGQVDSKTKRFYPSNRVCGNFCMGDAEWAAYQGWTGDEVFWEEEVTPSINLLSEGFSLVFPNLPLPLTHRYWEDDKDRQTLDDTFDDPRDIATLTNNHIAEFVRESRFACDRYAEYSGYNIVTNDLQINTVVPKTYGF
jgi:hypothetical protein